jgi:hypothetical protein
MLNNLTLTASSAHAHSPTIGGGGGAGAGGKEAGSSEVWTEMEIVPPCSTWNPSKGWEHGMYSVVSTLHKHGCTTGTDMHFVHDEDGGIIPCSVVVNFTQPGRRAKMSCHIKPLTKNEVLYSIYREGDTHVVNLKGEWDWVWSRIKGSVGKRC